MESMAEVLPLVATASRAERATLRAAREMARREAHSGQRAHLEQNDGLAITKAEAERLTTCHRRPYAKLEWRPLAARPPVVLPERTHEREKAARRMLTSFEPSWQDRMFGEEGARRRELTEKVIEATRADEVAFLQAYRAAETHNAECLVARRLLELDPKAIKDAVAMKSRLAELREGVNSIGLATAANGRLIVIANVIQEADVPYERITGEDPRTARRELIPPGERRRLHLSAVCAAALRIGAEMVCVLPTEAVEVVVECELETAPGERPTPQPILQLLMTTKALGDLDWKAGEAVTLATSLGARLDWSLEQGFAPIRPIPLSASGPPLAKSA